eukprot:555028-Rhodomonas_salina.1
MGGVGEVTQSRKREETTHRLHRPGVTVALIAQRQMKLFGQELEVDRRVVDSEADSEQESEPGRELEDNDRDKKCFGRASHG